MQVFARYSFCAPPGSNLVLEKLKKCWPDCIDYEERASRFVFNKNVLYKSPEHIELENLIEQLDDILKDSTQKERDYSKHQLKPSLNLSAPTAQQVARARYVTLESKYSSVPCSALIDGMYIAYKFPSKILHIHWFSWMAIITSQVRTFLEEQQMSGVELYPFYEAPRAWKNREELEKVKLALVPNFFAMRSSFTLSSELTKHPIHPGLLIHSIKDFEALGLPDVVLSPLNSGDITRSYCIFSKRFADAFMKQFPKVVKITPYFVAEDLF